MEKVKSFLAFSAPSKHLEERMLEDKLMKHEGIKIVSSLLDSVLSGVLINIGNEGVVQGIWEEREESSWDDYLVQRD